MKGVFVEFEMNKAVIMVAFFVDRSVKQARRSVA
jgi:hypothetical protein